MPISSYQLVVNITFKALTFYMSLSNWVVSGTNADLTQPLSIILKNFIVSKWTATTPAAANIRFRNDWWDGYGSYQIHFRNSDTPVRVLNLGWGYRQYDEYVMVHTFAKTSGPEAPVESENMTLEIQRIISENKDQLQLVGSVTKNSTMQIVQINEELLSRATASIWHKIIRVWIKYWKTAY